MGRRETSEHFRGPSAAGAGGIDVVPLPGATPDVVALPDGYLVRDAEGPIWHVASVEEEYAGAAWHERETAEMFGITVDGLNGWYGPYGCGYCAAALPTEPRTAAETIR